MVSRTTAGNRNFSDSMQKYCAIAVVCERPFIDICKEWSHETSRNTNASELSISSQKKRVLNDKQNRVQIDWL